LGKLLAEEGQRGGDIGTFLSYLSKFGRTSEKAKAVAHDTGQVDLEIGENIFPAPVDNRVFEVKGRKRERFYFLKKCPHWQITC